jgi:hypothetical protein
MRGGGNFRRFSKFPPHPEPLPARGRGEGTWGAAFGLRAAFA